MNDPTPPDPAPAAAEAPKPAPKCLMCATNEAMPGARICADCKARRDAATARVAAAAAVPPPPPPAPLARVGGARLARDLDRLVPPGGQTSPGPTPKPRMLPAAEGQKCIQCPRVMSEHPDPDDTPVRCGSCVRKNREQLRAFARGER